MFLRLFKIFNLNQAQMKARKEKNKLKYKIILKKKFNYKQII